MNLHENKKLFTNAAFAASEYLDIRPVYIGSFIIYHNLPSLHLKNHQNFKGKMTNEYSIEVLFLKQRIEAMPEDCILFRSNFPEYLTVFVKILSKLTADI